MFSALRRSGINVLRRYQTSGEKKGAQDKEDQTKILFSTPEEEEGEGKGKDGMDLGKKNSWDFQIPGCLSMCKKKSLLNGYFLLFVAIKYSHWKYLQHVRTSREAT